LCLVILNKLESLVSVIIPSFNKEKFISETIQSVLNQSYQNWELIIVDDLSSDRTVDFIKDFQIKDNRIKLFVNDKNSGANYSRNFGVKHSLGEYLIFLDADDTLLSSCIQNRLNYIENSDVDFCVFPMGTFYKTIGDSSSIWNPTSSNPLIDFLQHVLPWSILQPIWRKESVLKFGGFDESFSRLQDVEFHTRVLLNKDVKYKQVNSLPDCYYRIDEERKNFNSFIFYNKWAQSVQLYCDKFYPACKEIKLEKKLIGTVYKLYLQILFNVRIKTLSQEELSILEKQIFENELVYKVGSFKKSIFLLSKWYNLFFFRIKGVNWLLSKLLML